MNDREKAALTAMLGSSKYGAFPEDTVRSAFEQALERHRNLKVADKATRSALHQMSAMFFSEGERKEAYALLNGDRLFDRKSLFQLFGCHASTRERIISMDALYDKVFSLVGEPAKIVDYACGLNPLYLGMRGIPTLGLDIHKDAVDIVNRWALAANYPVTAEIRDVLAAENYPKGALALAMKLLPVLERERRSAARAFLLRVPCTHLLATFPMRTLGTRNLGMEAHYTDWFEKLLPPRFAILDRFIAGNELCYLAEVTNA